MNYALNEWKIRWKNCKQNKFYNINAMLRYIRRNIFIEISPNRYIHKIKINHPECNYEIK